MNTVVAIKPGVEPHNIEAEQQLLGALLLERIGPDVVYTHGGAGLFYDAVHAAIFKTIAGLAKADKLVSPITVAASMPEEALPGLSDLGGKAYFARLAGASVSGGMAESYAEILAEAKGKRDLSAILARAQASLSENVETVADISSRLEAALSVTQGASRTAPISMMAAVTEAMAEIHAAYTGAALPGVASGFPALDHMTGGFAAGDLWLLGGRPSMGKTGVMLSMALNAARAGHPVVIASLEMLPKAMVVRALSEQMAQMNRATKYTDLRRGDFNEAQGDVLTEAAKTLAQLPVFFLSREYGDTELLRAGVKQALRRVQTDKMPLVLVDYAQLLRSKAKSRYEQITEVSLALKGLAMSLSAPVVALSQLSRQLESRDDKRPMLSDLRESGQLEQDADGVIFCYRPSYYLERDQPDASNLDEVAAWQEVMHRVKNRLELIVAKQRQGQIGTANVMFNPAINRVWEA